MLIFVQKSVTMMNVILLNVITINVILLCVKMMNYDKNCSAV